MPCASPAALPRPAQLVCIRIFSLPALLPRVAGREEGGEGGEEIYEEGQSNMVNAKCANAAVALRIVLEVCAREYTTFTTCFFPRGEDAFLQLAICAGERPFGPRRRFEHCCSPDAFYRCRGSLVWCVWVCRCSALRSPPPFAVALVRPTSLRAGSLLSAQAANSAWSLA